MRLIDVSELKEWIENWFTKNRLYHPYAKNNNIPITELYDILEQMPSAQPEPSQVARDICTILENEQDMRVIAKQRWIPCSERLPDSPIRVLIQIDNGWIITAYYDYGYDDENKFWWSVPDWDIDGDGTYALPISNQVLAWLPLPEPWKGVE